MRVSFRQGIVQYTHPTFIQIDFPYVNLIASHVSPLLVNIAYSTSDYLHIEQEDIIHAWGPILPNIDSWLYIDIDKRTGKTTYGTVYIEPINGSIIPSNPQNNQHWFDTNTNEMKVWTSNVWIPKIRIFVCEIQRGSIPVSISVNSPNFDGTQIGNTSEVLSGYILFDADNNPIKNVNGQFVTSEETIRLKSFTSTDVKIAGLVIEAYAVVNIPAFTIIEFINFGEIQPASAFVAQIQRQYGIIEQDALTGQFVNVILEGLITNTNWDWTSAGVNAYVYNDDNGVVSATPTIPDQTPIGIIVDKNTIMLNIKNIISTLPPQKSTEDIYGISKLSVVPVDINNPIAVGDNDLRMSNARPPSAHTHPISEVTDLQTNLNTKLNLAGGTLTGDLVLFENPTVNLGAATKQYVDNVVLDAIHDVVLTTPSSGQGLTYNGTNWVNSTLVTSVGVSGGTTGLVTSGGPITSSGTITLSGILIAANGGTGNGFTKFTGPTTAEKTFTLPDSSQTLLYSGGILGTPLSGNFSTGTFTWPTSISSLAASASALKSPATTGLTTITGPTAGTTRAKTVRDADDTILELGGTYSPSGVWTHTGQIISTKTYSAVDGAGNIYLNSATGNRIDFGAVGLGAPTFTTRSAGTKLVLYPTVSGTATDFAIGMDSITMWLSVANTTSQFKWYGGTTLAATLTGLGVLTLVTPLASGSGGTGNAFTKFTGPTTAERVFTLPDSSQTLLYAGGALGTPASGALTNCTFPTLNQSTSGYASSLKSPATTGLTTITGPTAGTTRAKTVRDADDTILELGGTYSPSGVWTHTGQVISTKANNTADGGGQLFLNGATGNRIDFVGVGTNPPSFTTRSIGTKIVLYPNITGSSTDYAIGIDTSTMWFSVQVAAGAQFKWYGGTTLAATLTGAGALTLATPLASGSGGTGNAFTKFTGPTTAERVFTLPDSSQTLLYSGGALGTPASGVLTSCTGTASGLTAGNVTTNANLTGDVTSVGNATTLTNAPVIAKVLTGYTSGAGTIAATDSILSAIQKLNGNDVTNLATAKSYADGLVVGLWDDRGSFNASVNTFPTGGGSGTAGAIMKGDIWTISVIATSGSLLGHSVGTSIRAIIDTPGQTVGNWAIVEAGFGYVAANVANPLSQFASTTSAQLYGVMSDETGSGLLVFNNAPTFIAPVLGTPASGNFSTGTFTWPTSISSLSASASAVKSPATTGLTTITGPTAGTTRAKTVRDADDTILELGGTYTPSGVWTFSNDASISGLTIGKGNNNILTNTAIGGTVLASNTTAVATFGAITGGSGYTNGSYTNVLLTYVSGATASVYPRVDITVAGGIVTACTLTTANSGSKGGNGFTAISTVMSCPAASIGGTGSGFAISPATLASGTYNTGFGYQTLNSNTTGQYNTSSGYQSLFNNTTGVSNTSSGYQSLVGNTNGNYNTATGYASLASNISGNNNTAIGYASLINNTTGNNNTGIGYATIYSNTTSNYNTAIGTSTLYEIKATSKAITAFADYSGTVAGTVKATSVAHGLTGTTTKTISGTVYYNGNKSITVIDIDNFYFTAPWTFTQTGWWAVAGEGDSNTAIGYNTGRGIITGTGNTILGANVQGLASTLTNNIILASGGGIKAQHDGTDWTLTGKVNHPGQIISTSTYSATDGAGNIFLNSATGNRIDFSNQGAAAPTFTTRSAGTKIVLFPALNAGNVDYALGIDSNTLWFSVQAASGNQFKWYGGTTLAATLTGLGALTLATPLASGSGGTGNGFTKFTGPTTTERVFTLPDSNQTLLYAGGALGTPLSGTVTNLTGTASININGTVGATIPTTGAFTSLTIGTLGYAAANALATMQSSVAGYDQVIIRNSNTAVNASADFVVNNNSSTDTTYYGDFGINSSTYTGTGSLALPNATYLTATTGDLVIGTTTSNAIHFIVNNGATDALTISTAGITTLTGQLTSTSTYSTADGTGNIYLNSTTGNRIEFNQQGVAAPTFTTRSVGTKIVLFPSITTISVDYAIGIENNTLWNSSPTSTSVFKWYGGTTLAANLTGVGALTLSSTLIVPAGTALLPTLTTTADLNTGIWFPAADTVAVSTAGSERLRIDSSGNVGIGNTPSGTYKLEVTGAFAATTKSFNIIHPTKPDHRLQYGSLESPYHGIRLTGEGEVIDGICVIQLPDYISSLVHEEGINIQITNIKHGHILYVDDILLEDNIFTISCEDIGSYRFYWSFTAIRKDVDELEVEI